MNIPFKKFIVPTLTIGVLVVAGVFFMNRPHTVTAGPNDNVTGWALSDMPNNSDQLISPGNPYSGEGLGWISLNSTNANAGGGSYGVNLGTDGTFIGRGWSEYGGWVDFNPGGTGPDGTPAGARLADVTCLTNNTSCSVVGWIRFTSAQSDPQAGGWDGWVSMSGRNYGITLSAPIAGVRTFSGSAWGDRVVGWVDFRWAQVRILITEPIPGCTDPLATNYDPLATIEDGSCTYRPPVCPTPAPNPNYPLMSGYNSLCPCAARAGHPEDCSTVPPVKGCLIPGDPNYNGNATVSDNSMCVCPAGGYDPKTKSCPADPCHDGIDNNGNSLVDAKDPAECPAKGPKKPIFIET